jgi:hypothetical protein
MAIMDGSVFSVCRPFFAFVTSIALRYPIKKWSAIATEIATFAYLLIPVDAPKSLQCRIPIVVCSRRWIDCGLLGHSSQPTPSAKAWPEPQRVRRTNRHHSDRLDVHVRHDRHNSYCRRRNRKICGVSFLQRPALISNHQDAGHSRFQSCSYAGGTDGFYCHSAWG